MGKLSSSYGWFPGLSTFRPSLMTDWLDRSEIFLKGAVKPKSKNNNNKKML